MTKKPPSDRVLEVQIAALARRLVDLENQNSYLQETNSKLYIRSQTVEALLRDRSGSLGREQVEELARAADFYDDGRRPPETKISIMVPLAELVALRNFVGSSSS